ncbi:MAG TPA: hypothetical protein VHC20_02050 [Candidatus Paceibacterota bacterium]|nr:hypothetical protein [Candidatus Paceibacterota bacterium]
MKRLSNRDGTEWRTAFALATEPLLIAAIAVLGWYLLFRLTGFHAPHEDEIPLTAGGAGSIAFFFGVTVAYVYPRLWERTEVLTTALRKNDRAKFLERRDEQIPLPIHAILFTLSVALLFILSFLCYASTMSGVVTIGAAAYVIAILWKVGRIFDNPLPLLKCRTPPEWLLIDVQAFFKDEKAELARVAVLLDGH